KGLVSALHEQGRHDEARAEAERMPATVITRLLNDPDYVAVMASIHNARGDQAEGLRLVREAIGIYEAERRPTPASLEIQLAWLLLNSGGNPREQLEVLQATSARTDLTEKERGEIDQLWTVWSLRESNKAKKGGDYERASAI